MATGPRVPPEVSRGDAAHFLASVAVGRELPLFMVDDERKQRSDRYPPLRDGSPRGYHFFEAPGRLRLETIIHMAAAARLRDEFGWPRKHFVFESPSIVTDDGEVVLRYDALDILLLEEPRDTLASKLTVREARSRVCVEAKADAKRLDRLVNYMRACDGSSHNEHVKCRALDVFRPRLFLGVAAADTWRLFTVVEHNGRAVLGNELPSLGSLYFEM